MQECPNTFTVAAATSTGGGFNDDSTALLAPLLTASPAPGPGFAPTRSREREHRRTAIASSTDGRARDCCCDALPVARRAAPKRAAVRP